MLKRKNNRLHRIYDEACFFIIHLYTEAFRLNVIGNLSLLYS